MELNSKPCSFKFACPLNLSNSSRGQSLTAGRRSACAQCEFAGQRSSNLIIGTEQKINFCFWSSIMCMNGSDWCMITSATVNVQMCRWNARTRHVWGEEGWNYLQNKVWVESVEFIICGEGQVAGTQSCLRRGHKNWYPQQHGNICQHLMKAPLPGFIFTWLDS